MSLGNWMDKYREGESLGKGTNVGKGAKVGRLWSCFPHPEVR